jgi:hypothetical protein
MSAEQSRLGSTGRTTGRSSHVPFARRSLFVRGVCVGVFIFVQYGLRWLHRGARCSARTSFSKQVLTAHAGQGYAALAQQTVSAIPGLRGVGKSTCARPFFGALVFRALRHTLAPAHDKWQTGHAKPPAATSQTPPHRTIFSRHLFGRACHGWG